MAEQPPPAYDEILEELDSGTVERAMMLLLSAAGLRPEVRREGRALTDLGVLVGSDNRAGESVCTAYRYSGAAGTGKPP